MSSACAESTCSSVFCTRCHRLSVNRFVVVALGKSDRESAHRPRTARLHQRNDCRRIEAAGKQSTERHVGNHRSPIAEPSTDSAVERSVITQIVLDYGTLLSYSGGTTMVGIAEATVIQHCSRLPGGSGYSL